MSSKEAASTSTNLQIEEMEILPEKIDYVQMMIKTGEIEIDPNTAFVGHIYNCGSFKGLIDLFKVFFKNFDLYANKDGFRLVKGNDIGTILIESNIIGWRLLTYEYESEKDDYVMNINSVDLKNSLQGVTKTNGILLYKHPGDAALHMAILNDSASSDTRGQISLYPSVQNEINSYHIPIYETNEKEPAHKMKASEFNNVFMRISKGVTKRDVITINGYSKGLVIFKGINDGSSNNINQHHELGNIEEDEEELITIKTTPSTFKNLAKIKTLAPDSAVFIYVEKDKPLKILADVGHYGQIGIYLDSDPTLEER